MKKNLVFFTSVFLLILFWITAFPQAGFWDKFVSWYLSQKYRSSIEIHGVEISGWGKAVFRDLQIRETENAPAWVRAKNGFISFTGFPDSKRSEILLHEVTLGKNFGEKTSAFFAWAKNSSFSVPKLERTHFFILQRNDLACVRISEASSNDFWFYGRMEFRETRLEKLSARCAISRNVFSKWPIEVKNRMRPEKNGWRSAGLAFGGNTWTLRGVHGPLLQFSTRTVNHE